MNNQDIIQRCVSVIDSPKENNSGLQARQQTKAEIRGRVMTLRHNGYD